MGLNWMHSFMLSLTRHQMSLDAVTVLSTAPHYGKRTAASSKADLMLLMLYTPVGDTNWALQHIQDVCKVQLLVKRWKERENLWTGVSCRRDLIG
jgi:hypothetical protein